MHGGCSIPLGVYSQIDEDTITINAMISDIEGVKYIERSRTAKINDAKACADELARELLKAGGQEILQKIRDNC
jgi:hydroxymethylbilane synthase